MDKFEKIGKLLDEMEINYGAEKELKSYYFRNSFKEDSVDISILFDDEDDQLRIISPKIKSIAPDELLKVQEQILTINIYKMYYGALGLHIQNEQPRLVYYYSTSLKGRDIGKEELEEYINYIYYIYNEIDALLDKEIS